MRNNAVRSLYINEEIRLSLSKKRPDVIKMMMLLRLYFQDVVNLVLKTAITYPNRQWNGLTGAP